MKLPIYIYGHPVLRAEAKEVTADFPDLKKLVDDMFETMYNAEGIGLAAPQVGQSIRLVVIDADVLGNDFPECKGAKFTLVNPQMDILEGDPVTRAEGCLSLPGMSENVARVEHIRLRWLDTDFRPHEQEISGFLARAVQHELDHLDGKVYMDHVSPTRRLLLRNKLNNMAQGRISCDYKVKFAPRKRN